MQVLNFNFFDTIRSRNVPTTIYIPKTRQKTDMNVFVFSPGYQSQRELSNPRRKFANEKYTYLAEYFTKNGFAFISIQHDILGDQDGLESIDNNLIQHEARKHLYERGIQNISFVLNAISEQQLPISFEHFLIGGHSNGGDIAKYFANLYSEKISHVILFDARRCRMQPTSYLKLLMFEADDTTTDRYVLPEPKTDRSYLEWAIIKPSKILHESYIDQNINTEQKNYIYKTLDWFLGFDSNRSKQLLEEYLNR